MRVLFCDCCGDLIKVSYPCRFVFHDGLTYDFNICPDCMENETLEIDLKRKKLVAQILRSFQWPRIRQQKRVNPTGRNLRDPD